MDPELQAAVEKLADFLFAAEEPHRDELDKLRRTLPMGYERLVSLLLNLRLALQWRGFGVTHTSINLDSATLAGVPLRIRVFDPEIMQDPIWHALTRCGFRNVGYREDRVGSGGWVTATAPPELLERLGG